MSRTILLNSSLIRPWLGFLMLIDVSPSADGATTPATTALMRILIVEDEPRLLHNLTKALREGGYAVDTADAGEEGLHKARTYDYDAIVLDVMLPKLDGWQLLEKL